VANRTPARAEEIARQFGGSAISLDSVYEAVSAVDIVLCSTGAPYYVIRPAETARAIKGRKRRPLLFIDISVPRNIEPAVANLDNSFLFDVDDLDSVVKTNIKEREKQAGVAEALIEAEVENFLKQMRSFDIGPAVVEVKQLLAQMAANEFK